jgi:hypothetical protein
MRPLLDRSDDGGLAKVACISLDADGGYGSISTQQALITNYGVTAAVPEPSTWTMMILGFAGFGFLACRYKHGTLRLA